MRNRVIDIYKFIFCCVIAMMHFYKKSGAHMVGGGVGVEFFVMAAGLFFFKKLEREAAAPEGMDSIAYIKKRFVRFFPYTTAGLLLAFLVEKVWLYTSDGGVLTLGKIYKWFSRDIWDYLLVSMNGLNAGKSMLNGPLWTVSAMLICELLIWGLYRWNKQLFRTVIAPSAILFALAYWKNIEGTADHHAWIGFTTFGVVRVFGDYCLSFFIYEAAKHLTALGERLTTLARSLLTVCEFGCLALAIANMEFFDSRYFRYVNMLLFCVALVICFSGQSFSGRLFRHEKVAAYLGALSLSLYIVHYPILNVFRRLYPEQVMMEQHFLLFMAVVLVCSVLFDLLLRLIIAGAARLWTKLKPKMVVNK